MLIAPYTSKWRSTKSVSLWTHIPINAHPTCEKQKNRRDNHTASYWSFGIYIFCCRSSLTELDTSFSLLFTNRNSCREPSLLRSTLSTHSKQTYKCVKQSPFAHCIFVASISSFHKYLNISTPREPGEKFFFFSNKTQSPQWLGW